MRGRGLACCALGIGLLAACNVPLETYVGRDAATPDLPGPVVDASSTPPGDAAPPSFAQRAYLKAFYPGAGYVFGSVVALSADGSTLAVGSFDDASASTGVNGNDADASVPGAGAVHVFARTGTSWIEQAYLKASNTGAGDHFGISVSLSANGSVLAVGADQESSATPSDPSSNAAQYAGAVYLFTRGAGASWRQQDFVKATNAEAGDRFGSSVALSADGGTLAVGAVGESGGTGAPADNSLPAAGAAYVFSFVGGVATPRAYVKPFHPNTLDAFGSSIALSADGLTLAVGARFEDGSSIGTAGDPMALGSTNAGAVDVFRLAGGQWTQDAYLKASNTLPSTEFGDAVALSADGTTLAVGSGQEGSGGKGVNGTQGGDASSSGAVYVFVRANTVWTQEVYIKASNAARDSRFGTSVALSNDGSTLAVAAPSEDSNATGINGDQSNVLASNSGAAYLFVRTDTWRQTAYVKTSNTDAGDDLTSVALSGDGATLAVGADGEASNGGGGPSNNSVPSSGAAYVFH